MDRYNQYGKIIYSATTLHKIRKDVFEENSYRSDHKLKHKQKQLQ